jgi:hypothetical protein
MRPVGQRSERERGPRGAAPRDVGGTRHGLGTSGRQPVFNILNDEFENECEGVWRPVQCARCPIYIRQAYRLSAADREALEGPRGSARFGDSPSRVRNRGPLIEALSALNRPEQMDARNSAHSHGRAWACPLLAGAAATRVRSCSPKTLGARANASAMTAAEPPSAWRSRHLAVTPSREGGVFAAGNRDDCVMDMPPGGAWNPD